MPNKLSTCTPLFDMHCHLGFCEHTAKAARELGSLNISALSCTVLPGEYKQQNQTLINFPNVHVAAGLHPWWVGEFASAPAAEEQLSAAIEDASFIGEVGLDFSTKHIATKSLQIKFMRRIISKCTVLKGKVVSLHAVKSAGCVLDILQETGTCNANANNIFIMHWFSGSNDDLLRAKRLGCYFSVNARMLATKRGRAYAAAIPTNKLLLETDEPACAGETFNAHAIKEQLQNTLCNLAKLRKCHVHELEVVIANNSDFVLNSTSK